VTGKKKVWSMVGKKSADKGLQYIDTVIHRNPELEIQISPNPNLTNTIQAPNNQMDIEIDFSPKPKLPNPPEPNAMSIENPTPTNAPHPQSPTLKPKTPDPQSQIQLSSGMKRSILERNDEKIFRHLSQDEDLEVEITFPTTKNSEFNSGYGNTQSAIDNTLRFKQWADSKKFYNKSEVLKRPKPDIDNGDWTRSRDGFRKICTNKARERRTENLNLETMRERFKKTDLKCSDKKKMKGERKGKGEGYDAFLDDEEDYVPGEEDGEEDGDGDGEGGWGVIDEANSEEEQTARKDVGGGPFGVEDIIRMEEGSESESQDEDNEEPLEDNQQMSENNEQLSEKLQGECDLDDELKEMQILVGTLSYF
jgi:hypothetical protein